MEKSLSHQLTHRLAQPADIPDIVNLMQLSIAENMKAFLSSARQINGYSDIDHPLLKFCHSNIQMQKSPN
jgi:hypothetical protein